MLGVADSLNVSVSAAVLLYEARRQRGATPDGQTDGMDRLRLRRSSAPGRPARRPPTRPASSARRVAVVDRRWFGGSCPHIGCVPSKALLHGAARHAREPGDVRLAAGLGAARLHGQPGRRRRRARRHEPRPRRSRRPAPSPTAATARIAGRGPRRRSRHDGATHELAGRERRRRGRLGVEGPADRGHRRRSRPGRTARRPSPASCRAACSSSAAGRPAASWPRSTPGSASRRRSSSPGRGSPRPTIRATPRRSGRPSSATA